MHYVTKLDIKLTMINTLHDIAFSEITKGYV